MEYAFAITISGPRYEIKQASNPGKGVVYDSKYPPGLDFEHTSIAKLCVFRLKRPSFQPATQLDWERD
jgi:hypothetical protein